MTNVKWWLWLHLNCGGGPCLVRYIYPGDFQQNDHCMWQKPFGQEFKWLIIMKSKQQFLTFLFVFTISTTIISLCVLEKCSALFHAYGPRSDSFCNFKGTEPTRHSSLLSHHMTAKCAYYIQKVICKPSWPMTKCHVTIPVIIITVLMRLMMCFWHFWLYFKQNGVPNLGSVAQVLTLLSFCCLYFAFTGNRCLYSAYV